MGQLEDKAGEVSFSNMKPAELLEYWTKTPEGQRVLVRDFLKQTPAQYQRDFIGHWGIKLRRNLARNRITPREFAFIYRGLGDADREVYDMALQFVPDEFFAELRKQTVLH